MHGQKLQVITGFLCFLQRLDYLGEVFHLHDNDDSDKEENRKRNALAQHEEKKKSVKVSLVLFPLDIICGACPVYFQRHRRRSQKIGFQKRIKEEFAAGVWNVNSVLLGGLGNEPLPNGNSLLPPPEGDLANPYCCDQQYGTWKASSQLVFCFAEVDSEDEDTSSSSTQVGSTVAFQYTDIKAFAKRVIDACFCDM